MDTTDKSQEQNMMKVQQCYGLCLYGCHWNCLNFHWWCEWQQRDEFCTETSYLLRFDQMPQNWLDGASPGSRTITIGAWACANRRMRGIHFNALWIKAAYKCSPFTITAKATKLFRAKCGLLLIITTQSWVLLAKEKTEAKIPQKHKWTEWLQQPTGVAEHYLVIIRWNLWVADFLPSKKDRIHSGEPIWMHILSN